MEFTKAETRILASQIVIEADEMRVIVDPRYGTINEAVLSYEGKIYYVNPQEGKIYTADEVIQMPEWFRKELWKAVVEMYNSSAIALVAELVKDPKERELFEWIAGKEVE